MNKPFGLSAKLQGHLWKDMSEELEKDGITLKIHKGLIEVEYENEKDEQKARKIAQLYIYSHSLRMGKRLKANFNHSWKSQSTGGTSHTIELTEKMNLSDRVQIGQTHQVSITAKAYIVSQQMYDSASFSNDSSMVDKALNNLVLEKSLEYFAEEVVDDDRPSYGIYKALEVIINQFGKNGRKKLGLLAGKNKKYISEVMETTNTKRHADSHARKLLNDNECIERARILIEAYARSL